MFCTYNFGKLILVTSLMFLAYREIVDTDSSHEFK